MALAAPAAVAADICGETVPANRFIDGIPAYAQCASSMTTAVYSNNGTDTSTTSGGAGWVRTQGSGGYQCTELAHRYLYFKWNVTSVPNGNAGVWCDGAIPTGLVKATTPVHGDLIVLAPGSCGADATTGHVAVVDVVNADTSVTAVQQNIASRSKYMASCAACFLHVTANDGSASDGGVPPGDAGHDAAGGSSGIGGTSGSAGTTGNAGTTGSSGTTGSAGTTGNAGTTGSGGTTGSAGTTGAAGTTGSAGSTGAGTGGASAVDAGGTKFGDPNGCAVAPSGDRDGLLAIGLIAFVLLGTRRRRAR